MGPLCSVLVSSRKKLHDLFHVMGVVSALALYGVGVSMLYQLGGWVLIGEVYSGMFALSASIFAYDVYMYPVCPECGDNLISERVSHQSPLATCQTHGSFFTV